jgi:hypothetical protein
MAASLINGRCPSPVSWSGPIRINIPPKPNISPAIIRKLGLGPLKNNQYSTTNHNGTVATMSAVIPDGTFSSAQAIRPLPMSSSKAPIIAAERQCTLKGAGEPLALAIMYIILPATKYLTPDIRNGGKLCMLKRIAR